MIKDIAIISIDMSTCDFDLIPVEEFVEGIKMEAFTDYDGIGVPVIKASGDRLLYQDKKVSLDKVMNQKKLDFDFVAWFNK